MRSAATTTTHLARRALLALWIRNHLHWLVVLVICVVTVGLAVRESCLQAERARDAHLDRMLAEIRRDLLARLDRYEQLLHVSRGLFEASDHVGRDEWRLFVHEMKLGETAPGVVGLAYVELVHPGMLEAFENEMRSDGVPDFRVHSTFADPRPDPGGPLYVIKYHEPMESNRQAIGLDVSASAANRRVYDQAAAGNETRMSHPLRLRQGSGDSWATVLCLPVFFRVTEAGSADSHPADLRGWIAAPIDLPAFFAASWSPAWNGFVIELRQPDSPLGDQPLYRTVAGAHGTDAGAVDLSLARSSTMEFHGQRLELRLVPASAGLAAPDYTSAWMLLGVGGTTTALLTTIAWMATRTRTHAMSMAKQMTESLRRSEQTQRELASRAEAASQAKSEFLANMSHEIRTPMTAILGYADLLGEQADENDRRESVRAIRTAGRHLLTIINDVLDLSKIESGRMEVNPVPCDVPALVMEVVNGLRPQADRKNLRLSVAVNGPVPERVVTDPHRVRQVLINLLGNAVKFTEHGGVAVRLSHRGDALEISVIDSGVGINPEQLERIFLPFEQGDNSAARRHEGTGLGLAISRRLAGMLGGDLTARSREGAGSEFTLRLHAPAEPGSPVFTSLEKREQAAQEGTQGCPPLRGTVLLAEDGPDNQRLISHILRRAGLEVEVVSNGREALEAVNAGRVFGLIISDMQMPEMDGYTAVRQLRASGYESPILALTAHAMAGDRQRCLDAGCDDYETKPVDRESLLHTVRRLIESGAARRRSWERPAA